MPKTSDRKVDLIVTELAVIRPTDEGLLLLEIAQGITVKQVQDVTEAKLIINDCVGEIPGN